MNDVYDYHSDIINTRKLKSGLEGGVLFPVYHTSVRSAAYLSTGLIFFTSLLSLKPQNVLSTSLLIILGWQYSAPPLRLKETPFLDSCSNGLIVFLAWLVGYTFGRGRLSSIPDKAFVLSLCTAGVHALGAVVDVESDTAAGQTTIATFFGHRFAAAYGASMFVTSLATVNRSNMVLNVYLRCGTVIMLAPCFQPSWAHYAFKAVVFWTVGMVVAWFGSKAFMSMHNRRQLAAGGYSGPARKSGTMSLTGAAI
ncbi:hypothetical protein JB92DRAFT_2866833 [Gautieria morchelliformis]|nr:hypothetical protein JB92DRAFT_2866833 [Gautieria morchelliformis]